MTKEEQLSKGKPKTPRTRKCLTCRKWFKPLEQGTITCSPDCAIMYGKTNLTKQRKKEQRKAKLDFNKNDKSKLLKDAQFHFNKYIRKRDQGQTCISCGHNGNRQRHAGHFMPVGSNGHIRFDENNCHSQCSICNNHKSGNLSEYEPNLIKKIGQGEVDRLKQKFTRTYSVEELKEIISTYKLKYKGLV